MDAALGHTVGWTNTSKEDCWTNRNASVWIQYSYARTGGPIRLMDCWTNRNADGWIQHAGTGGPIRLMD